MYGRVATVSGWWGRRAVAWGRDWRSGLGRETLAGLPGVADCIGAGEELDKEKRRGLVEDVSLRVIG